MPKSTATALLALQRRVAHLAVDVDRLAEQLATAEARRHADDAARLVFSAVSGLGAAALLEDRCAATPADPDVLTATVVSPGADRADELVRTIPAHVQTLSPRHIALRLGVADDAAGARVVSEVMTRNGWRQFGLTGEWFRVPPPAGAVDIGQPR